MPDNTGPRSPTATDTPVITSPLAMIVHGHVWLADLHDPAAPIWVHPDDARPAWQWDHLDATCSCDSRSHVWRDERGVMVTTGHADRCGWFTGWLNAAGLGEGIGVAGLAVTS
jgi:hypothetical protein